MSTRKKFTHVPRRPCFCHKIHDDDDDEGGAGEDVPARHSLPRHHQRLQQCQVSGHPDSMRKNPTKELKNVK